MLTAETGLGSNPGLPSETPSTLHCWRCDGRTVEASARRFEAPCDRTEVKRSSQIGSDKRWAAYLSSPSVCMADRLAPEHLRDVSTTLHHQSALNVALPRHLPRKHGFTYSQGANSARAHTHTHTNDTRAYRNVRQCNHSAIADMRHMQQTRSSLNFYKFCKLSEPTGSY